MYLALLIFLIAYIFLVIGKPNKVIVVGLAVFLLLLTGTIDIDQAVMSINWNVIGLFVGMLLIADLFIASGMPAFLAQVLTTQVKTIGAAILAMCVLSSVISAFVENVATVLILAPIAILLAKKLKVHSAPFLIGIAIASNLQGTATLVGDPPSMILGSWLKMTFNDFFWYMGRPGIFFAVEIGAAVSFIILYWIFKKYKQKIDHKVEIQKVRSFFPTILLIGLILALALASFWWQDVEYMAGGICLLFALIGWVWELYKEGTQSVRMLKKLDWATTLFLVGIFIVVGSLASSGAIEFLSLKLGSVLGGNPFLVYSVIIWVSVLFSAFVDNVPYIVAMLPIASLLAVNLGVSETLLTFGLLLGASVGGNITPIGASANIVAVGLAKKQAGEDISFWQFVKIGLPFTISAIVASWLFGWLVWG